MHARSERINRHNKKCAARIVGVVLVLGMAPARAETYSADEAVAYALKHNARLGAAREQLSAANARAQAAAGGRLPRLDAHYLLRRSDNALDAFADKLNTRSVTPATDFSADALNHPGGSTLHNTGVALQWPVYTGGRIDAGIGEAQHQERAAGFGYDRLRQVIAYETLTAYRGAQAAQAALKIADDAVAAAERHARTTARLLAQKRIVASDNLSADVNLGLIRAQRERGVTRQRSALTQLKRVMGLPFETALVIEPWNEAAITMPTPTPLETLEQRALEQRRDVAAQRALIEAGRRRVDSVRAADKPEVSVFAAENWYNDSLGLSNSAFSVGASVKFNLYNGGRNREEIRAAQHDTSEREQQLLALSQQVRQEVRDAYDALTEARARVAIAQDNADKAERTTTLVRGRYGEGRTILLDLLQSERVLVEARTEQLAATLDLAIAAAALELAGGTLARASE